jgi:uncharacterized protein (TIGR00375 family)
VEYIADLHIHSYLSRATAKNLNLEYLNLWAKLKGITVVGTGDFTHPQWFSELSEKLEPAEDGLFSLKPEFAAETASMVPSTCEGPVRFVLSVEISSIYKKGGKTRKVHNVVLVPTLDAARKINQRLDQIGNIASDGRPILGLDSKALLEIILEVSDDAVLIPAHIWTPWFSVLGSKSGFDSIEACFEDLTPHIFAVETGLSSDPAMNWRVSSLDGLALVSNSDAHSPGNLGREANLFDTELSYFSMMDALRTGDSNGFLGTLEYFAEEGKYHYDGHRKCGVRLSPAETVERQGLCPVCGKPVTVGVMYRVQALADREPGHKPKGGPTYKSLLPLTDVLSQVLQVGPKSKKVGRVYRELLENIGPEFEILKNTPLGVFEKTGVPLLSEAVKRMRENRVRIAPGFDGEFGTVSLFTAEEREQLLGQIRLFEMPSNVRESGKPAKAQSSSFDKTVSSVSQPMKPPFKKTGRGDSEADPVSKGAFFAEGLLENLNGSQQEAVRHSGGPLLIVAGPGTGKTRTLTHRIAYLLSTGIVQPEQVLAVTFTNKAAQEMRIRLEKIVDDSNVLHRVTIKTFHALCLDILLAEAESAQKPRSSSVSIVNETDRRALVQAAIREVSEVSRRPEKILGLISLAKQHMLGPEDDLSTVIPKALEGQVNRIYREYQQLLLKNQCVDFDDLIFKVVKLFETKDTVQEKYRKQFSFVSVDEYQDINFGQYRLVRLLAPADHDLCVIGDPNQAIYGFRGADVRYFQRFCRDYPTAKTVYLRRNYRSTETILEASEQVIRVIGRDREGERTWSGIEGPKKITVAQLPTEKSEAEHIVKTIDRQVGGISHFSVDSGRVDAGRPSTERSFGDFAVLYRVRDQARALQEAFHRSGIPFQNVGEERLESCKGIAEIVSYLKMGWSVATDLDLERILGFPARGKGKKTAKGLKRWAQENGCSLSDALNSAGEALGGDDRTISGLADLRDNIREFKAVIDGKSVCDQIRLAIDHFGLSESLPDDEIFEANLENALAVARPLGYDYGKFLACLALEKDQDFYDNRAEKVALMTMHASKGLEFPVVFVAGCEDGFIPYCTGKPEDRDIEEERRLFYVALTRAKEELYLTHARKRLRFGKMIDRRPSSFLEAIEEDLKGYEQPFSEQRSPKKADVQLSLF